MLTNTDLNKIAELFKTLFNESFKSIWEHNLEPSLNQIHDDISKLPTKEYIDDKLSTQKIEILTTVRKEYKK